MATDVMTTRTNYFKVTDREAFDRLMNRTCTDGDDLEVWENPDDDGKIAFGVYGDVIGLMEKDEDGYENLKDNSYDEWIGELQKLIAEDDACIITTAGHCKLRTVYGSAVIVTRNATDFLDLTNAAIEKAKKILGPDWTTRESY